MSWESFDFTNFWDEPAEPATEEQIAATEEKLGRKLPQSYVEMLKIQNGGTPVNSEVWVESVGYSLEITAIHGAGDGENSLLEAQKLAEEEGFPPVGPAICDCISGGREMIFLDYTQRGRTGEPTVITIDAECDYSRNKIADSFEEFIRGMKSENAIKERWQQAEEEHAAKQKKKSIWQKINDFFVGSGD